MTNAIIFLSHLSHFQNISSSFFFILNFSRFDTQMSQPTSQTSRSGSKKITIGVKDQQGTVVHFKILSDMKFKELMHMYCKKKQLDYERVRFVYEGDRVLSKYTPEKLKMEDEAEIFCMVHQVGGATFY